MAHAILLVCVCMLDILLSRLFTMLHAIWSPGGAVVFVDPHVAQWMTGDEAISEEER